MAAQNLGTKTSANIEKKEIIPADTSLAVNTNASSVEGKINAGDAAVTEVPGYDPFLSWTEREERAAVFKADTCILLVLVVLFCFLQFDRTSISNALTSTIKKDIRVGTTQVNNAQTLFIAGFIITEIPFNWISKMVGPERFLPCTMFLWGIVTWSQIFLRDYRGLYAARFFIGALEGGYIPGMALYISRMYTNKELALRLAMFWAANSFAGALGGPLALGLLSLDGRHGLKGWQWLFLIEGVLTSFLGLVAYLYLPHSPVLPKKFFGRSANVFPARQGSILVTRCLRDDPSKASRFGKPLRFVDLRDTFLDWRIYGHLVSAFLSMIMIYPMNTYSPSLIKSFGYSTLTSNGLNSVGSVLALFVTLSLAFSSDKFRERGIHIAIGILWGVVGLLWLALAPNGVSKGVLYAGVVVTQGGMGSAQAINAAWLVSVMEERKRPIALAAYVMSIQLAGFPGNQLFTAKEAPRYKHALITAACCAASGAVVILAWKALYHFMGVKPYSRENDAETGEKEDK